MSSFNDSGFPLRGNDDFMCKANEHTLTHMLRRKVIRGTVLAILVVASAVACAAPSGAAPQLTGAAPQGRGARGGRGGSITAGRIQRRSYQFAPTNERMDYAIYISSRVKLDQPSPLVIVLHGLNTSPVAFLPRVTDAVPNTNYILAAPMGYSVQGWYGANGANGIGQGRATGFPANLGELSEKDVMNVLDIMRKEFKVDSNRIYIMGNSMGGAGAIHLGLKHRDIWAAVGARAPAIRQWLHTPAELERAGNLPMVLVHGDADRAVPVTLSRQWAAKAKEVGMIFEYHELPGVGHSPDMDGIRRIFKFFDNHSKARGGDR